MAFKIRKSARVVTFMRGFFGLCAREIFMRASINLRVNVVIFTYGQALMRAWKFLCADFL